MFEPRIFIRTLLPNATVKTIYMTSDGLETAVHDLVTNTKVAASATLLETTGVFAASAAGCMVRMTSGLNIGLSRKCVTRTSDTAIICNAFPSNNVLSDTFILERAIQAVREAELWVETGGHCHVAPFNRGAALVADPKVDDTMIKRYKIHEGTTQIDLLTDSDVSAIYVNVEGV